MLNQIIRFLSLTFCITVLSLSTNAATLDDVRNLLENGDYKAAMQTVEPLLKKSPKDAATNYWYGMAAAGLGKNQAAIDAFSVAADRGYTAAYPELVQLCLDRYDIERAQSVMSNWKAALKKAKKSEPQEISELENRIILMTNQLERVEDIPVIARYDISFDTFKKALNRINSIPESGVSFVLESVPFFINNFSTEIFKTKKDENGESRLYLAGVLDDGSLEEPVMLTEYIGDGDILAPFMLSDGETLYFAADGRDDSLGGYDIYMTRRNDEGGFYEPSNLGMPYNSPANDYLFVIDDENNLGWWATDRFAAPDSVSILVFVPNSTRRNLSPEDPDIMSRAKVSDISKSVPKDFDINGAKKRLAGLAKEADNKKATSTFTLSLGDGRIITSTSQFRNRQAATQMSEVLRAERILKDNIERLDSLRRAYAGGDKSLKEDILSLENEVERQSQQIKTATNAVIRLETSSR